jgi:O-antigen/teichoic acid export membrane protein
MLDKIKSLSKQTLVYGTSQIIGRFLNFILVPFYTNIFPPAEYGVIAVIYSYIAFLNIIYSAGFESGYFKFASTLEIGDEKENFSIPFLTIFVNSAFFSLVILFFSSPLSKLIGIRNAPEIIIYTALILFFDALVIVPFARLRLKNKAKKFAALKITNIVLNVVLNFVLILVFKLGIVAVFISNLAASIITFILLIPDIYKSIELRYNAALFNELSKFSLPYIPAGLSAIIVQVLDRPIMKYLTDDATVGIYQANYRLGIFMMLIVSMFEYAWRPFFLNTANQPNAKEIFSKVLTIFMGFSSIILIILTFFIEDIIKIPLPKRGHLIGAQYWSGVYIVPVILYAYIFNGIYVNLIAGIYIEKKTKFLPLITGLGAIINVVANFILIPYYGIMGGAIATFLSYFAMAIYIYFVTQRFYPVKYELNRIYLLHLLNVIGITLYYLTYYAVIPSGLIIKLFMVVALSLMIFYSSGLIKAKSTIT